MVSHWALQSLLLVKDWWRLDEEGSSHPSELNFHFYRVIYFYLAQDFKIISISLLESCLWILPELHKMSAGRCTVDILYNSFWLH